MGRGGKENSCSEVCAGNRGKSTAESSLGDPRMRAGSVLLGSVTIGECAGRGQSVGETIESVDGQGDPFTQRRRSSHGERGPEFKDDAGN